MRESVREPRRVPSRPPSSPAEASDERDALRDARTLRPGSSVVVGVVGGRRRTRPARPGRADRAAELDPHLDRRARPRAAVALRRAAVRRHPRRGHPARQPAAGRRRDVARHHRGAVEVGARARRGGPALHRMGRAGRSRPPEARPRHADLGANKVRGKGTTEEPAKSKVEAQAVAAEVEERIERRPQAQGRPDPAHRAPGLGPGVRRPAARRRGLLRHRHVRRVTGSATRARYAVEGVRGWAPSEGREAFEVGPDAGETGLGDRA